MDSCVFVSEYGAHTSFHANGIHTQIGDFVRRRLSGHTEMIFCNRQRPHSPVAIEEISTFRVTDIQPVATVPGSVWMQSCGHSRCQNLPCDWRAPCGSSLVIILKIGTFRLADSLWLQSCRHSCNRDNPRDWRTASNFKCGCSPVAIFEIKTFRVTGGQPVAAVPWPFSRSGRSD